MKRDQPNWTAERESKPFAASNPSEELIMRELPSQYTLLSKISQGGMGAIYKAKNRYTGAMVAIKVLLLEKAQGREKAMQRFVTEAKAASSLRHPLICPVHDFGITENKVPYLIMDWIDGIALGKKITRDSNMQVGEALRVFEQVATALAYMHQNKVVHRDMKPDNIMLSRDAEGRTIVHLVDFGIAKVMPDEEQGSTHALQLTSDGAVVGTPLFMSPEQARGLADVDWRSDIYSFGCVMYFVLTGEPPFVGPTVIDTIAKHLHQPPKEFPARLKIPAPLRLLVFKCLEKSPDDRYQNVEQILTDLTKVGQGASLRHRPLAGERERTRQRLRAVLFFVLGFAIMSAVSILWQNVFDSTNASSKHDTTSKQAIAEPSQATATQAVAEPKQEPAKKAHNSKAPSRSKGKN
jgi:serine/threonine-protein kinase